MNTVSSRIGTTIGIVVGFQWVDFWMCLLTYGAVKIARR